jgi:bis(5'-nucleosidyl)-tetraphosphatase
MRLLTASWKFIKGFINLNVKFKKVKSCGILLFTSDKKSFLLMRHWNRWDLPKGHIKKTETELEGALREFFEETGIDPKKVKIDPDFRFEIVYYPKYIRLGFQTVEKTLVVFLGFVSKKLPVAPTEHSGYEWIEYSPNLKIQQKIIDPLIEAAMLYFESINGEVSENNKMGSD